MGMLMLLVDQYYHAEPYMRGIQLCAMKTQEKFLTFT
ncbi:hypothetical protein BpHYR1_007096 [Brachionus plicatilis]|uniref:Uncharacterized protein n=1 Tax=Brachionus plicatilis TaxID=10195 RepID=A0A3M7PSQ6_BRAPC|nr:hypothetical protein BpHYR1_007096 [Brachionus plicatilis]